MGPTQRRVTMESKFTKSQANKGTENKGLALLLTDPRFQVVDLVTKRRIIELVGGTGDFGTQTFDAVMTPEPTEPITLENVDNHFEALKLVEMKTTRKPIRGAGLSGFFFGATEREYAMAKALGSRYLFAFIVLNEKNSYEKPFAVLLPLDEVERRTSKKRVQYQVNFRSGINDADPPPESVIVFGSGEHIPSSDTEPPPIGRVT